MEAVLDLRRMLIRPKTEQLVRRSGLEEFQNIFTLIQTEYTIVIECCDFDISTAFIGEHGNILETHKKCIQNSYSIN